MFQDSVPAGSYNDPFLSSVCTYVCIFNNKYIYRIILTCIGHGEYLEPMRDLEFRWLVFGKKKEVWATRSVIQLLCSHLQIYLEVPEKNGGPPNHPKFVFSMKIYIYIKKY